QEIRTVLRRAQRRVDRTGRRKSESQNAAFRQIRDAAGQEIVIRDRAVEERIRIAQRLVRMVVVPEARATVRERVELEMTPDETGSIRETVGKSRRRGQEQQPSALDGRTAHADDGGTYAVLDAVGVDVDASGRRSALVDGD